VSIRKVIPAVNVINHVIHVLNLKNVYHAIKVLEENYLIINVCARLVSMKKHLLHVEFVNGHAKNVLIMKIVKNARHVQNLNITIATMKI